MNGVNVVITVKIFPTESVEKVQQAVQNLFPTVTKFQSQQLESHLHIEVNGESGLTLIFARLREQRILAAARRVFRRGLVEKSVLFYLNKQAALANRISFCEPKDELSLGSIKVQIFCDDPEGIIDWLTLCTVST
jgi:predicted RNA binding protein with dsRBD fold (UPF0201 family)